MSYDNNVFAKQAQVTTQSELRRFLEPSDCRKGFRVAMVTACIARFGEAEPSKSKFDRHGPTNDKYANELLSKFVGSGCFGTFAALRLFLKTTVARELGMYLMTGQADPTVLEKYNRMDKAFWVGGYGHSLSTKALPPHIPTGCERREEAERFFSNAYSID